MSEDKNPQGSGRERRLNSVVIAVLVLAATGIVNTVIALLTNNSINAVQDALTVSPPTCANPLDLRPLRRSDYKVSGHWFYEMDRYFSSLPVGKLKDYQNLRPERAVDGSTNTLWVPPASKLTDQTGPSGVYIPQPGRSTLTLRLDKANDVELVCVVNGYASETQRYRNWGRVHALRTSTDQGVRPSILQTKGDCCFQNPQDVPFEHGTTRTVALTVLNAYTGQIVFTQDGDFCDRETQNDSGRNIDPDDPRDPDDAWELAVSPGCYLGAQKKAGLAEVVLYVKA